MFIASRVNSPAVREKLDHVWEATLTALPPDANTWREEEPHITLRFIGNVDEATEEALAVMMDVLAKRFLQVPLVLGDVGCFDGVLYVGVGGTMESLEALSVLVSRVEHMVGTLGLDDGVAPLLPFVPHIAAARFRKDTTAETRQRLEGVTYPGHAHFDLEGFELMESIMSDGLVTYRTARSYHFRRKVLNGLHRPPD